jgi:hypothetical protein
MAFGGKVVLNIGILREDCMECAYCGIDFNGKPFRRDGEIYCSKECADADSEERYGLDAEEIDDYGEEVEEEDLEEEF